MTKTSATPTKREAGFTLIELLVVLSIVSLLAFLLAGRLPAPERYGSRKDVAQIMALMSATRLQALMTGRSATVPATDMPGGYAMAPALGKGEGPVIFYPDGSSNGGTVRRGETNVVLVDWFSGLARHAE